MIFPLIFPGFKINLPGIFSLFLKYDFHSGFEYIHANLLSFIVNKKFITSIILQISEPSFLFPSNLVNFVLFQGSQG